LNFETSSEKLLQVILSGQPELQEVLNRPALRQLKQRISLRCQVKPLSVFEINKYITRDIIEEVIEAFDLSPSSLRSNPSSSRFDDEASSGV